MAGRGSSDIDLHMGHPQTAVVFRPALGRPKQGGGGQDPKRRIMDCWTCLLLVVTLFSRLFVGVPPKIQTRLYLLGLWFVDT